MSPDSDGVRDDRVMLETKVERWRLACPLDHRGSGLEPREGHWYCTQCATRGIDPKYSFVRDNLDGAMLAPDEVLIL